MTDAAALDWFSLCTDLFGGLALFLGGLEVLSEGLKKAAGQALKAVLSRLTTHRVMGALTGALVTGVLNSSSVTTVLVVGFVTAGMMTLAQSVGVIMGANIGSTVTAQLLAFNLAAYALVPVALGFFMYFAGKAERLRHLGLVVLGLGLVFYGMGLMSEGMRPLRTFEPFLELLRGMERPVLGLLSGALFTALVQSSAATVGIAIAMAGEGLLSLPGGITLALGANIGTCVTALLAAMGKPTQARRAAVVHLTFNVAGALLWLPFIAQLAALASGVSPAHPELVGEARLAAEVPRQIANANTLFNVINTALFIGFTGAFAGLAVRLVPERKPRAGELVEPEFLDDAALAAPSLALQGVRLELARAGEIAHAMLVDVGPAFRDRDLARVEAIARRDDDVDRLERAILAYLARLRQSALTETESRTLQQLMTATVNLESLADIVETDMVALVHEARQLRPSEEVRQLAGELYQSVCEATRWAVQAVRNEDADAARRVLAMRERIHLQYDDMLERQLGELREAGDELLDLVRLQSSVLEKLRQVYTHAKRIARTALPPEEAAAP